MPKSPLEILIEGGVVLEGHFVLKSGKHANTYVNKDLAVVDPHIVERLCYDLARHCRGKRTSASVVIGAPYGAISFGHVLARAISVLTGDCVRSVYAEKTGDGKGLLLRKSFAPIIEGKEVIGMEDILTTGGTAKELMELVRQHGGKPVLLAALWNRGGVTKDDVGGIPIISLVEERLSDWEPVACPLCRNGVPINTNVGHGRKL